MFENRRIGHNFSRNVWNVMVSLDLQDCYGSDRNLVLDPKVSGLNVTLLAQTLSTSKCLGCIAVRFNGNVDIDTEVAKIWLDPKCMKTSIKTSSSSERTSPGLDKDTVTTIPVTLGEAVGILVVKVGECSLNVDGEDGVVGVLVEKTWTNLWRSSAPAGRPMVNW